MINNVFVMFVFRINNVNKTFMKRDESISLDWRKKKILFYRTVRMGFEQFQQPVDGKTIYPIEMDRRRVTVVLVIRV